MKQVEWFKRKFDFSIEQNIFPSILERLEGTPIRLNNKIRTIALEYLIIKPDNKWSIQENIGHLIDLESIWQGRLEDILSGKEYLRSADLKNKKTDLEKHNEKDINALLTQFQIVRSASINSLMVLSEIEIYEYALHPRLNTPMRTMDLFLFIAEHDDHHLAKISELNRLLKTQNNLH